MQFCYLSTVLGTNNCAIKNSRIMRKNYGKFVDLIVNYHLDECHHGDKYQYKNDKYYRLRKIDWLHDPHAIQQQVNKGQ